MISNLEIIKQSLPLFSRGLLMTLMLWLTAGALSFMLGTILGVISFTKYRTTFLSSTIRAYVFLLRGIPVYIQVLMFYFALPQLIGLNMPAFLAAALALGICSSAYVTEIVRSGLQAIPIIQWEAAYVLGYTKWQTLRFIILPQLARIITPPLANESDGLLKSTAILSSIGLLELTRVANNVVSRHMNPEIVYPTVAVFYLILSTTILVISRSLERRFNYAVRS
jgi:His/Glu/Gln/Arg/opine family amino acid ABC transporter permease subunit